MTVLDITEVKLEWSDLHNLHYHPRQEEVRRTGELHVTDVLRHVAMQHKTYTDEDRDDEMPLRILLGLAFEEAAARLYKYIHWQPGQLEHDGVIGSPDGITFGDLTMRTTCVEEFKYTGKSQRVKGVKPRPDGTMDLKDIRTEWMWMQQGMSYVNLYRRVLTGTPITRCRYHICWKYGTYTYPMREVYYRYLVEFTEAELRGNWAMLQAHKNEVTEILGF